MEIQWIKIAVAMFDVEKIKLILSMLTVILWYCSGFGLYVLRENATGVGD